MTETTIEAIIAEMDAATLAYNAVNMQNAHPSFLATLTAEERLRRDAHYATVRERYFKACAAYDAQVQRYRDRSASKD